MNLKTLPALAVLALASPVQAQYSMDHGTHLGADVMPFDLPRSLHIFTPLDDGGRQEIISRDGDREQVELIRQHLRKEAEAFSRGDYSDPANIHGTSMPGLRELEAASQKIEVRFAELPNGALLRFTAHDPAAIEALHEWFRAQVRDHGADAVMGKP